MRAVVRTSEIHWNTQEMASFVYCDPAFEISRSDKRRLEAPEFTGNRGQTQKGLS